MREEMCVYLWLSHVDVWQKPTQYCKAIIFQLKNTSKKFIEDSDSDKWFTWGYSVSKQLS